MLAHCGFLVCGSVRSHKTSELMVVLIILGDGESHLRVCAIPPLLLWSNRRLWM